MRGARTTLATVVTATVLTTTATAAVGRDEAAARHTPVVELATTAPPRVEAVTLKRRVSALGVKWARVNGDVRYVLQKSVAGGAWKRAGSTTQTTHRVKRLEPHPTRIRVRAIRNGVRGRWSAPVKMTPSDPAWLGRRFGTLPPGADLPSGATCASRVRPVREQRPGNARRNATRGTAHDQYRRVRGAFTGTTDEILQWVACKWGVNENLVRAQAVVESRWHQNARGDYTKRLKHCHPSLRTRRPCPTSVGIFQIGYRWHRAAFEDRNAIRSTPYNADYLWQLWRDCYDGKYTWLNSVAHGRPYPTGQRAYGCVAVNNTGTWYTRSARTYIGYVKQHREQLTWQQPGF